MKKPRKHKVSGVCKFSVLRFELSLAELGRAAGGFEAVLLTLLHTRIAGEEAGALEGGAVLLVHLEEGPGHAVADGAGLAGDAAAGDGGHDVHLAQVLGGDQGLADDELQGLQAEVVVDVTAVDADGAGAVGEEVDAGHGGLPAASTVVVRLLALIHLRNSSLFLSPGLGLLSRVDVLSAAVDLQTGQRVLGDDVAGHHAADGQLHGQLGLVLHQQAVLGLVQAAGIAAVGAVELLLQLLAGEDGLLGVDDDDEIAAVGVGRILGLMLAAQQGGGGGSGLAEGLASRVQNVPLADDVALVGHKSGHGLTSNLYFYDKFGPNMIDAPLIRSGA